MTPHAPESRVDRRRIALLAVALLALAGPLRGEEPLRAYRATHVVLAAEDAPQSGALLVRGQRVEGFVPLGEELPDGVEAVELGDVWLVPGFVDPLTAMDSRSYSQSAPGRASQSNGAPRDARAAVAAQGVDPSDVLWRRLGRTGYTSFAFVPNGASGLVAGQASVLRPAVGGEEKASDLVISESAYLLLGYASGKPWHDAARQYWKKAIDDEIKAREERRKAEEAKKKAEEEAKKKAEEAKKAGAEAPAAEPPKPPEKPADDKPKPPDPLVEAFEGKRRIFLRLGSPASIDHAFALLDSLAWKPRFVLVTGSQAPDVVERLAKRRDRISGVVLEARVGTIWETSIWTSTAREFLREGIPVALLPISDSLDGHLRMPFCLAEMVRAGLLETEALAAVTSVPAAFLGLEGQVGSLMEGARADFTVWDDSPLSGTATLRSAWVGGERVYFDDPETGELSGEAVR